MRTEGLSAHQLAEKLLSGPDIPVVIVDTQECYRLYWVVEEVIEVTEKPMDGDIEPPYVELQ